MTAADDLRSDHVLIYRFETLPRKSQYEVTIALYPEEWDRDRSPRLMGHSLVTRAKVDGTLDKLREEIESRHSDPLDEAAFERAITIYVVAYGVVALVILAIIAYAVYSALG